MRERLLFLIRYYIFWLGIFISQKLIFMAFNYRESLSLKFTTWLLVLWNGFRLDLSAGAYIMFIPVIGILAGILAGSRFTRLFLNIYTAIILFIVLGLGVVDTDLYSYWGFKLDITPLLYLRTPGEAMASVGFWEIFLFLLLFAVLYYIFFRIYLRIINPSGIRNRTRWWVSVPSFLLLLLLLIIPARGGFGIAPMNVGSVYFSPDRFANHSAINVLWNTIYSITERKNLEEDHHFMADKEAGEIFRSLMQSPEYHETSIVKKNASVVLVILESFSDKIISELGGEQGVTPTMNKLCSGGSSLVFKNFYASGDRSDKGMTSIFGGYPSQPTTSIMVYPKKSEELPSIFEDFSKAGYRTAFYYGGDLNFANFRAFFSNPYIHRRETIRDFPDSLATQKWGVPDQYLFRRITDDIDTTRGRFFYSCFTLSSHEPYDVPMKPVFPPDTRDNLCRNSFYYADKCLGEFLDQAKLSSWWDSTLIVIVADHGSRSPGNTPNHVEKKFRIPMIWTGGALLKDSIIVKTGSQTDIPATLLSQLGWNHDKFPYSKNLLNPGGPAFAFYAFNNGFGFKTDSNFVVWDNDYNKAVEETGNSTDSSATEGKAFLQVLSADFLSK